MLWNTLLLALRSIRRNLMRSFLTILGIVIGVAAVITMVTLGNGATQSVSDQISSMGSNLLMVIPGQRFGPGSGGAPSFKSADVDAVRNQISGAERVAPVVGTSATVVNQANNWSTSVTGSTSDFFPAGNWEMAAGRVFSETEERAGKAVCVIGETVREKLFGRQNPVGGEIRVKQFSCEVIGLLKSKGQSAMGHDQDDIVVMPLRTVQRRLVGSQDINMTISVRGASSIDAVKQQITLLLRERRNIGENQDDDFRVMDTRQIAETLTSTTKILTMLLGAVAAVSLLVGGIGIMNIMLVSVTERTREIGIRLAIGALEREVLLQFLIEAVVLSSLGGLVGIALATGASLFLAGLMGVPYIFDPAINLVSFLFSAAIGVIFGFFPARRAAGLNPIDALRHE
ncbi:MAG TPA: FtsX-like permease family protein [Desulfonatronum sp.]|nr:FtsX-like permease family protein [Desulfonatronum sp.]